jgi:Concanavalin A-like lectin/glucanases superfamily
MLAFPVSHWSASDSGGLPTHSLDFERSSSQSLSITDANFGSYDRAKFAISLWLKKESNVDSAIITQWASGQFAFEAGFDGNRLSLISEADGSNVNGSLTATATVTGTSWHHVMWHFDSANATAGNRMRLWFDGSEVTTFDSDINPNAAVFDSNAVVTIGGPSAFGHYDGLIYQLGFFSGSLPSIGSVYNAGSPVDISGLTGLYSFLDCAGNDPTSDGVLASNWTNNNGVTTSTDIP